MKGHFLSKDKLIQGFVLDKKKKKNLYCESFKLVLVVLKGHRVYYKFVSGNHIYNV